MQIQDTRMDALRLIGAYRISRFMGILADLGLPDRIAAEQQSADSLATACGVHAPSLRRLLRLLVAAEVLEQDERGRFRLTPIGEELKADRLGPLARYFGAPFHWEAWARADHSIRTGDCAFDFVYGMHDWDYFAKNPDAGALFDAAMSANTSGLAKAVVNACDFSRFAVVADVDGGDGTLLAEILRACPRVRGILFDLPTVIERARPRMAERGVTDRCEPVAGSFLESVPRGADAYAMKAILHDWEDVIAAKIVANVRQAADAGSVLLVVERVLPERVGPGDLEALLADVLMMVGTGGLERTEAEYGRLFSSGGYQLERVVPTGTAVSVLEAVAV
jgi:O-methyltransferase